MLRTDSTREAVTSATVQILLCAMAFLSHFYYFRQLGLYEDDYAVIGEVVAMGDLPRMGAHLAGILTRWPQGRPLGFGFPALFSMIAAASQSLRVLYVIGFAILSLNTLLVFHLARRFTSLECALLVSLLFCLFPGDTTRTFLTHLFILQVSLAFCLMALHLYYRDRTVLSYAAIVGSLLTYESTVLLFIAAPILAAGRDGKKRRLLRHLVVVGGIVLVVLVARRLLGEERAAGIELSSAYKSALSMLMGPAVAVSTFLYAPAEVLRGVRMLSGAAVPLILIALISAALFTVVVVRNRRRMLALPSVSFGVSRETPSQRTFRLTAALEDSTMPVVRLAIFGLVGLVLSYASSFVHFPPLALKGRMTSVHLGASVGASILLGCTAYFALQSLLRCAAVRCRLVAKALYVALFAAVILYGSYGVVIQRDFAQSWQNQRSFWTSVLRVCPDAADGTVIFVHGELPRTRFIESNSWADPIIYGQLIQPATAWTVPPRVFVVDETWPSGAKAMGARLMWKVPTATWWSHWEELPEGNVILVRYTAGAYVRESGTVFLAGRSFTLKSRGTEAPAPAVAEGFLYRYLVGRERGDRL